MGLFRKKKAAKDLQLPEASLTFPELPSEEHEGRRELPALPQLPSLSQIKTLPQLESVERTAPKLPMPMPKHAMPAMPETIIPRAAMPKVREPIFVKIDKFKDAMANFELIKKRLNESSSLLEKIRETRAKEEEELNEWAEELNSVKQKISIIDKKIFSNLD